MRGLFSILASFPNYLRLAWRLMKDGRVPWLHKLLVVAAILYWISPIDLVPEILNPFLGYGEDFIFFILSLRSLIRNSPKEIVTEYARQIAEENKR